MDHFLGVFIVAVVLCVDVLIVSRALGAAWNVSKRGEIACGFCFQTSPWGVRVCRHCQAAVFYHPRYGSALLALTFTLLIGVVVVGFFLGPIAKDHRLLWYVPVAIGLTFFGAVLHRSRGPRFIRKY